MVHQKKKNLALATKFIQEVLTGISGNANLLQSLQTMEDTAERKLLPLITEALILYDEGSKAKGMCQLEEHLI